MDALVVAALDEISLEGPSGLKLPKLWGVLQSVASTLEIPLDADVKQIVWQGVVDVPGLLLLPPKRTVGDLPRPAADPAFANVEDVEKADLSILAHDGLRDGCLGAYDFKHSDARLSDIQRATLERLAKARYAGVTQNELAKEFKKGGNAMFYVMKNLEVRGLLTRQSTIVRNNDQEQFKLGSIVSTNLVHLTRFAKNSTLGSHQRFEISRSSSSNDPDGLIQDGVPDEDGGAPKSKTYVVNDDFPAMRTICEKLQQAAEKVLVVSDVKLALGYRHAAGHRAWRRLSKRLQDAGLVEIFDAQIDRKVVSCVKLLKSFDAKAINASNDDAECETSLRGGKRGQITEQLADLPIDYQIYEQIENAGVEGIHMMEVLKRLGLHNKRNYYRVTNMMATQVVLSEAETHKRSTLYRLRTPQHAAAAAAQRSSQCLVGAGSSDHPPEAPSGYRCSAVALPEAASNMSTAVDQDVTEVQAKETTEKTGDKLAMVEAGLQESALAIVELQPVNSEIDSATDGLNLPIEPPARTDNQSAFAGSRTNAERAQRIYQRLQAERFILRVELHRWLEDIEERKGTMLDRKTLSRVLQKMESKGLCKIMKLSIPGLTNYGRNRESEAILLPEVEITTDFVKKLHERVRKFDAESRGQGVSRAKSSLNVPVLTGVVKRIIHPKKPVVPVIIPVKLKSLQENGFIPAKMVRVRMFHYYLWSYVTGKFNLRDHVAEGKDGVSSEADADLGGESSKSTIFALASAVHAMPLELYLQIIGSTRSVERVSERCKEGIRLRDIPPEELKAIIEHNSSGRLSWLVDVLCRLQLVQLKMGQGPIVRKKLKLGRTLSAAEASLSYALALNSSLEEPASQAFPPFAIDIFSASPGEWHNFSLTSTKELDEYWQTLEYFYSGADPATGKRHFPGSRVPEVFGLRSWTSLRIMSIEQRTELLKRIGAGGPETRKSAFECAKIAKDLNLSLEQVLRVSYEKNRRLKLMEIAKAAADNANPPEISGQSGLKLSAKKRTFVGLAASEPPHVQAYKRQRQLLLDASASSAVTRVPPYPRDYEEPAKDESHQLISDEKDEDEDDCEGTGPGETPANFVVALRPSRARRFSWSERLDRILIGCYAKQRAMLGAKHQRVDWGSMPGLPAPPQASRRRMSQLRSDPAVRKAVLKFCSLLATRYLEFLEQSRGTQNKVDNEEAAKTATGCRNLGPVLSSDTSFLRRAETNPEKSDRQEDPCKEDWNYMEDTSVLLGLEEVMRCKIESQSKRLAGSLGRGVSKSKLATFQYESTQSFSGNLPPLETSEFQVATDALDCPRPPTPGSPTACDAGNTITMYSCTETVSARTVRKRNRERKVSSPSFVSRLSVNDMVRKSLCIANAVELLKLVMLNSSQKEPEALVEVMKRYKHGDILKAYFYLRKHELVGLGGPDRKPFVLSAKFHDDCSASRFPAGSGDEARNMESLLRRQSRALQTEWMPLSPDQTCGQLLQLFGLVAAGEFVLAPSLPDEGIGESEEYTSGTKRKADSDVDQRSVRPKLQPCDSHQNANLRRERGFPGVGVTVHAASSQPPDIAASTSGLQPKNQASAVEYTTGADKDAMRTCTSDITKYSEQDGVQNVAGPLPTDERRAGSKEQLLAKCIEEISKASTTTPAVQSPGLSLEPASLTCIYHAIEKASDAGVAMDELFEVMLRTGSPDGEHLGAEQAEAYVHALQRFNLVHKVNAFDHVRVIAAEHAGPFLLHVKDDSAAAGLSTADSILEVDAFRSSSSNDVDVDNGGPGCSPEGKPRLYGSSVSDAAVMQRTSSGGQSLGAASGIPRNCNTHEPPKVTTRVIPMRPWLTANGAINSKFVKAMTRRVLGAVTLSPGITEDHLIEHMKVLNPQSARDFLHILEADGHLVVRPRVQPQVTTPPRLLTHLINAEAIGSRTQLFRHYYPNPFDAGRL